LSETLSRIRAIVGNVIRGKPEAVDLVLVALVAGGHVLLEDVPGVGKTTLAKALARVCGAEFTRVQFTPDLLPADITGGLVLEPEKGAFAFHKGPVFANILLADEINRASPRTQAALLEAMNEAQVTVDGATHPLPEPFFVIATQNPSDYQGTYPLPEAQLDRFLVRLSIGYPSRAEALAMLYAHQRAAPIDAVEPACDRADLLRMQREVREVEVKPAVADYVMTLVERTREHPDLDLGVSPRGALALFRAAQAAAYAAGRAYATPDDVQRLAPHVIAHRVQLSTQARYGGGNAAAVIRKLLGEVRVPT
jgi:MoxR-like ATPase